MRFPKEYYIRDREQINVYYDNDSSGGTLTPEKIADGTPFEHREIVNSYGGRRKVIVINNWCNHDLMNTDFHDYIDNLLDDEFTVLQADGELLHSINNIKQIKNHPSVIFDEKKLQELLLLHELKISADQTFILDYYNTQLITKKDFYSENNNVLNNDVALNYSDLILSKVHQEEYLRIAHNKTIFLYLFGIDQESLDFCQLNAQYPISIELVDLKILNNLYPVVKDIIIHDNSQTTPSKFIEIINTAPLFLKKITTLILNSTYLIPHIDKFKHVTKLLIDSDISHVMSTLNKDKIKQLSKLRVLSLEEFGTQNIFDLFSSELPLKSLVVSYESQPLLSHCHLQWSTLENIKIINNDEMIYSLLSNHNRTLQNIGLSCNRINIPQKLTFFQLKSLSIKSCEHQIVIDESLNNLLADTPNLSELILKDCDLAVTNLFSLTKTLRNLQVLELFNTRITSSQLNTILLASPNLEELRISHSIIIITQELSDKVSLPYLKELILDNTAFTPNSINALLKMSNCIEHIQMQIVPNPVIRHYPQSLSSLVLEANSNTAEDTIWETVAYLANLNLSKNTSVKLDLSAIREFTQEPYAWARSTIHNITSIKFPHVITDINYLHFLIQTPNISNRALSKSLLNSCKILFSQRLAIEPVTAPINLENITDLNFEKPISLSVLDSLLAGCHNVQTITFDNININIKYSLAKDLYLPYLWKIVFCKSNYISIKDIHILIKAAPNLKVIDISYNKFINYITELSSSLFKKHIGIISYTSEETLNIYSCFIANSDKTLMQELSNYKIDKFIKTIRINNPSFLYKVYNKFQVKTSELYVGSMYVPPYTEFAHLFQDKHIDLDECVLCARYATLNQLYIDASLITQYMSHDGELIIYYAIVDGEFNACLNTISLINTIISFASLKTLLNNNTNKSCVINLSNPIIIADNVEEVHNFVKLHSDNFESPKYTVNSFFPNQTAELFKFATQRGFDPVIRYNYLRTEYKIIHTQYVLSHNPSITPQIAELPAAQALSNFTPYRSPSSAPPAVDNNTWSQSLLIDRLNKYIKLNNTNYSDAIFAINNRGICDAVSEWYSETITQQGVLNLNDGIDLWDEKLRTLKAWDSKYAPPQGSITELFLNQLLQHTYKIHIGKSDTISHSIIMLDLKQLLQNPPKQPIYPCNAWHKTCLIFKDNLWLFFDPNNRTGKAISFKKGQEQQLENTIFRVLGYGLEIIIKQKIQKSLWSVENPLSVKAAGGLNINSQQAIYNEILPTDRLVDFFNGGGFLLILNSPNCQNILINFNIASRKTDELDGIFYNTIKDKPFWYIGLITESVRYFTLYWLEIYKSLDIEKYNKNIAKGLELLTLSEQEQITNILTITSKHGLINITETTTCAIENQSPLVKITQYPTVNISESLDDQSILKSISNKKIASTHAHTYKSISYDKLSSPLLKFHLELYKKSIIRPVQANNIFLNKKIDTYIPKTLSEFDYQLLSADTQNILLEFTDNIKLINYLHHLQTTPKAISRRLFVVNSSRDLNCLTSNVYIKPNNTCLIRKSPSGALSDFIDENQDHVAIIVINCSQLSTKEIIIANNIFDRTLGSYIPKNTLIIALQNIQASNAYRGADFISRQNKIIRFPLNIEVPCISWKKDLRQAVDDTPIIIEFFKDPNWQRYLYGHFGMHNNMMTFYPSKFLNYIKHASSSTSLNFVFKNAPQHLEYFRFAINSLFSTGYIEYKGLKYPMPFINITTDIGYDFIIPEPTISFFEGYTTNYDVVLNPSTLPLFFVQFGYTEDIDGIGQISTLDGFIKLWAGCDLNVYLTRNILISDFAKLFSEALTHQCRINITLAPGTYLPSELSSVLTHDARVRDNDNVQECTAKLIISNDLRMQEQQLLAENPAVTIIDVSELKQNDLFFNITARAELTEFVINQEIKDIWHAICNGTTVVFKGRISAALADYLAPLFKPNGHIYFNGMLQKALGKIIILTENGDVFNYVFHKEIINYTFIERIEALSDENFKEYAQHHQAELLKLSFDQLFSLSKQSPYPTYPKTWLLKIYHLPPINTYDDDYNLGSVSNSSSESLRPAGRRDLNCQQPLDEVSAKTFLTDRFRRILTGVMREPILFILGPTSSAKSSTMHEMFEDRTLKTDVFFGDIVNWALSRTENTSILFIDEFNLQNTDFSEFESLFNHSRTIFHNGKLYPLTKNHVVVFAGNPDTYGGGRNIPALLTNHPNIEFFDEMSNAYLFHYVCKVFIDDDKTVGTIFLKVFRKIQSFDKSLISARELQMMGFLFKIKTEYDDRIMRAKQCAWSIAYPLLTVSQGDEFKVWFKEEFGELIQIQNTYPKALAAAHNKSQHKFYLVPNHYDLYDKLEDLIKVRAFKQKTDDEKMKFGGIAGIFIEGNPGVGKSIFIKQYLLSKGFEERKIERMLTTVKSSDYIKQISNHFYDLPASMNPLLKVELLYKAFHEGAVVIIDEINASELNGLVEIAINSTLMGEDREGNRAINPGFTILSTGNPRSMLNRKKSSAAIERRFIYYKYTDYTIEQMLEILILMGMPHKTAYIVISEYIEAINDNTCDIAPSFRTLVRKAITLIDRKIELSNHLLYLPSVCCELIGVMTESINETNINLQRNSATKYTKDSLSFAMHKKSHQLPKDNLHWEADNKWIDAIFEVMSMFKSSFFASSDTIETSENVKKIEDFIQSIVYLLNTTSLYQKMVNIIQNELKLSPHYNKFIMQIKAELIKSTTTAKALWSVDNSSSEVLRPATCSRDPEILINAQHYCTELDRSRSREQVAGRRDMNYQQTIAIANSFDLIKSINITYAYYNNKIQTLKKLTFFADKIEKLTLKCNDIFEEINSQGLSVKSITRLNHEFSKALDAIEQENDMTPPLTLEDSLLENKTSKHNRFFKFESKRAHISKEIDNIRIDIEVGPTITALKFKLC